MQKIILGVFLFLIIILNSSCNNNQNTPANVVNNPATADNPSSAKGLPNIVFDTDFHNFGKLINGEKVTYSFTFTNKGEGLLLISSANSSCGCTVSSFPNKPIAPGKTGTIDVKFDSEGRVGLNNKTITVLSNSQPSVTTLRIQANVVNPENI